MIRRLSLNVALKLFLVVRIEKCSKSGVLLMSFNGRIIITFNSFASGCRNSQVFTRSDLKMMISIAIIDSIAATTLKFCKQC